MKGIELMEKRKKLLFHINSMGKGGAEKVVSVLSERFAKDGYETVVATLWQADTEYTLSDDVRRINLGDKNSSKNRGRIALALGRLLDLRKMIREERPDLVISFCNKANFRCAYSMAGIKIPLLVSVRNDPRVDYYPHKYGMRQMEKKASGCVFQTYDAMECFGEEFRKKSKVIWNPLDDKYMVSGCKGEERSNYIVSVGRLCVQKNQLLLLKAFRRIMEEFPQYELRIYGEESDAGVKESLCKYIDENGMGGRVRFMGQSSHLEREMRDASLFVLSSDYEGLPNALMEAMALGIPVVSTDCSCGGPREVIEDGVSGLLIPTGSEEGLFMAVKKLLNDPKLAWQIGKEGEKVKEKASPDAIYQEWKKFVEELT